MRRVILSIVTAAGVAASLPAMAAPSAGAVKVDDTAARSALVDKTQWRDHDRYDHDRGYHRGYYRGYHYGWRRPSYGYYYSSCRWGYWRDRWGRLHCRNRW